MTKYEQHTRFPGFRAQYKRDYFTYPTELEGWWHELTGAEQKVLTFVLRNTLGFQKTSDFISISQFVNGIGSKNKGTGVSRAQVPRALKSLEEKGYITLQGRKFRTTEICLVLQKGAEASEPSAGAPLAEIARLIELFRDIAGHQTDGFKTSKRQVKAMEVLVSHYGSQAVEQAIQLARATSGQKYAPTITSPVELEKKWPSLMVYLRKSQKKQTRVEL